MIHVYFGTLRSGQNNQSVTPGSEPQHRSSAKATNVKQGERGDIMNDKSTGHGAWTKPGEGLKVNNEEKSIVFMPANPFFFVEMSHVLLQHYQEMTLTRPHCFTG